MFKISGNYVWTINTEEVANNMSKPVNSFYSKVFNLRRDYTYKSPEGKDEIRQQLISLRLKGSIRLLPRVKEGEDRIEIGTYLMWVNPPYTGTAGNEKLEISYQFFYEFGDGNVERGPTFTNVFMHRRRFFGERETVDIPWGPTPATMRHGCSFTISCDCPQESYKPRYELDADLTKERQIGSLGSSFKELRDAGQFCDVTIVCQGVKFPCHKMVLAARSDVFRTMFSHTSTKEAQTNIVDIVDFDADAVRAMLDYLYTDELDKPGKYALRLLPLADKYNLTRLRLECECYLANSITEDNAVHILLLADLHSLAGLSTIAVNYIALNVNNVKEADHWEELVCRHPDLIEKVVQVTVPPGASSYSIKRELEELRDRLEYVKEEGRGARYVNQTDWL